ncbi:MAG TPA: glycosyl hydrolase, partial [Vicinamibacteria bacterium]|nr:glycosyl hydrolase [Vicinamibacteria bacterium]
MTRPRSASIVGVLALGLTGTAMVSAQPAATPGLAAIRRSFVAPPDESRPMVRWWWFGPSVTREEIEAEMRRMKEGGFGGFELAVVYPMALDDPAAALLNERYLSPGFLDKVAFASRKARELGLRMDVTIGSGWSYGGPYITPGLAAARLRSEGHEITPDRTSVARPVPYEDDRLVAAFIGRGSMQEADPRSFRELDLSGDGPIALPAGNGPRVVLFYFASHSGQMVKRAALGAEGYVLDHFSRPALETHLREAGDKLLAAAGPGGVRAIFCDSLEVYDADWTADLLEQFRARRGYDLRPLLPRLERDAGDRSLELRRDFGRTLSELYEERFLVPLKEWSRKNNVLLRIQNYGEPPATLSSSRHADLIDGEGWKYRELTSSRWASSASHLFGRPVTTSETWTWLHSPAFRATPLDVKAEADQHFLSGINQLIGHGWPYSPPQVGTPGWPFYAAAVLSDRNPWWPVMPDLAAYLQRVSFVLRQGESVVDVALYAPTEDAWATFRPGTSMNLFRKIVELVGPNVVPGILAAGHAFDLVDDGSIKEAEARRYKAIVLPGVRFVPEATRRFLADYARAGGTVIAVRRIPEGEWPSLTVVSEAELSGRLAAAAAPDVAFEPAATDVGFVHRRRPDADVYFVANTGNAPRRVTARFRAQRPQAEMWNALTGVVERVDVTEAGLALDLEPYGSRIVAFQANTSDVPVARKTAVTASEDLRSGWTVSFGGQGSGAAVEMPHSWAEDPRTSHFS